MMVKNSMHRILTKMTLSLSVLALSAGLSMAQPTLDPMDAMRGRPAAADPLDPMSALRASKETNEGKETVDEFDGLPAGPAAEVTYYNCAICHSTEIIKQQRVTDTRWDYLWDWMIESQGMIEPDDETKAQILDYLKTHFSSER